MQILALLAAGFAIQAVAVVRLERSGRRWGAPLLLVALVLRLPLLALPPTLSDDVLRYVWDGRVVNAGENPYRLAPEAPELSPLRDELWRRLPHRAVPTVYPPLAMGAFSIAARTPFPVLTCKLLALAADLAACALLLTLARRRNVPDGRVAWYAWSPLVALETAGMGHVDVLAVAPLIAALLWLTPRRREEDSAPPAPLASAAALAAGTLAKLAPAAALPMAARLSGRPVRYVAVAVLLIAAGLVPVAASVGGAPPGLVTYGVSWEFNGPLHAPLWRFLEAVDAPRLAARLLDGVEKVTGRYELLDPLYPFLYPQLLAKLLLALGALAAVAGSLRCRDAVRGSLRLFGTLLVCSATVYPWYLLWVLPWAALERSRPWLLAAVLMPLAYLPQLTGGDLFPTLWAAIWLPPAALAFLWSPPGRRFAGWLRRDVRGAERGRMGR